jgi:hypothetical protein
VGVSAAVVAGADPRDAARVALGIARAESTRRSVAVGDLVGDLAALYEIAGGEDAFGLADCIRGGLPLNDVARPAPNNASLFIMPAGTPPVATHDIFAHERWKRLANGFAEAGALLLLVAPLDAPGLEELVGSVGGLVSVAIPPQRVRKFHVLATVDAPSEVPTPAVPSPPGSVSTGARRRRALAGGAAALAIAAGAGGWLLVRARRPYPERVSTAPAVVPTAALATTAVVPSESPRADTVRLAAVVNPADSGRAATFAVELVAANTSAGAFSVLQETERDVLLPASTVVPVQLGGGALWYKVIAGAWHGRTTADSTLGALRARGVVRPTAGAVVRVPYALLLAGGVPRTRAAAEVNVWRARGISAYALLQDDGSVRVYAGAFETPAQAAALGASVRDAGATPVVAFRTGRAF